jgi:hypothetical protein
MSLYLATVIRDFSSHPAEKYDSGALGGQVPDEITSSGLRAKVRVLEDLGRDRSWLRAGHRSQRRGVYTRGAGKGTRLNETDGALSVH